MKQIKVALNNRRAYFQTDFHYTQILKSIFRFHPDGYFWSPKYRAHLWDGYVSLLKKDGDDYYVGTGLFLALKDIIEKQYDFKFIVDDISEPPDFYKIGAESDRPYQRECLDAMIKASHSGGLILAATGVGKTRQTGMYFSRLKGNACFIVDELMLLKQAQSELQKVIGEDVGNIGDMEFNPKRITVATVQTLELHQKDPRFMPWTQTLDVLVIDEIHVMLSKRSFDVVKNIEPRAVFGLTATLQLKKKPIRMLAYNLCGPVIFTYPITQGVEEGYLAPGVAVFVEFHNTQTGRSPNYHIEYDSAIAKNAARNNLIEGLARAGIAAGRSVIILVERIKHLKDLSYRFYDLPHKLICGAKPADQRIIDKNKFERSEVKLILATKVLKKGIDIRKVDMIIDAAALGSQNDAVQKFGRGVRTCDGKKGLLYFDIADIGVDRWQKEIRSRFTVSARKRISAFKAQKIPLVRVSDLWNDDYGKVIRDAIAKLETLLVKQTELSA